jgi:hypothetical protein
VSTYTLGHNAYSHLTWPEFQAMFNLGQVKQSKGLFPHPWPTEHP